MKTSNATSGAVDLAACPRKIGRCRCGAPCRICGLHEHFSVHGPWPGKLPGSAPWSHRYWPEGDEEWLG